MTPTDITTLAIAVAALCVSLMNLYFMSRNVRRSDPKVAVRLVFTALHDTDKLLCTVALTNRGRAATTIQEIIWEHKRDRFSYWTEYANLGKDEHDIRNWIEDAERRYYDRTYAVVEQTVGPELPYRLESYSAQSWAVIVKPDIPWSDERIIRVRVKHSGGALRSRRAYVWETYGYYSEPSEAPSPDVSGS